MPAQSSPPAHILLVRQDTHVGSLWLTKLLEAQHVSAFFQFDGGQCRPGQSRQPRSPQALFDEGCRCHGPHAGEGTSVVARGAKETKEDAFCHGRCGAPGASSEVPCKAVLAMADTQRAREILAKSAFRTPPRLVSLHRDNLAKRAVSSLKADCGHWARDLSNHASAADVSNVSSPTYLLIDPRLFLAEALGSARHQQALLRSFPPSRVAHAACYEEWQLDPDAALRRLFADLGLDLDEQGGGGDGGGDGGGRVDGGGGNGGPSARAAGTGNPLLHARTTSKSSRPRTTSKSGREQLSRLLLNFDAVANATAARWPCLLPQLHSAAPRRWPPCHPRTWSTTEPPPPTVPGAGRTVVVSCARETCSGAAPRRWRVPFSQCFAAQRVGRRLCARALAHARRQWPGAETASLCVRTMDSRDNGDSSWLRVQDAQALVKGESSPRGPEVITSALASAAI